MHLKTTSHSTVVKENLNDPPENLDPTYQQSQIQIDIQTDHVSHNVNETFRQNNGINRLKDLYKHAELSRNYFNAAMTRNSFFSRFV